MRGNGEQQGGGYALVEFIGLYIRFFFFFILGKRRNLKYLSGEADFPKVNKMQRIYCLTVGLIGIISAIAIIFYFIA